MAADYHETARCFHKNYSSSSSAIASIVAIGGGFLDQAIRVIPDHRWLSQLVCASI